jgi:hypothetical protein
MLRIESNDSHFDSFFADVCALPTSGAASTQRVL